MNDEWSMYSRYAIWTDQELLKTKNLNLTLLVYIAFKVEGKDPKIRKLYDFWD